MTAIEHALAEEIRTLIAHDQDVAHTWDDDRVVREAERRLCGQACDRDVKSLIGGMPDYWLAIVQQARQAGEARRSNPLATHLQR